MLSHRNVFHKLKILWHNWWKHQITHYIGHYISWITQSSLLSNITVSFLETWFYKSTLLLYCTWPLGICMLLICSWNCYCWVTKCLRFVETKLRSRQVRPFVILLWLGTKVWKIYFLPGMNLSYQEENRGKIWQELLSPIIFLAECKQTLYLYLGSTMVVICM